MSIRAERLHDLFIEIGSDIIKRIKDPAVNDINSDGTCRIISLTDVKIASDMSVAQFFVSVLGDQDSLSSVVEGLNRAAGYFRRELKKEVSLKKIPEVHFIPDDTMAKAGHIMDLIASTGVKASDPQAAADSEAAALID